MDLHHFKAKNIEKTIEKTWGFNLWARKFLGVDTTPTGPAHGPAMPCAQLQRFDVRPCKAWRVGHFFFVSEQKTYPLVMSK